MAMTLRLELRQAQSLVMTPQLQQAIKLLQLSNMELSEFVENELAENPMLERADSVNEAPTEPEADLPEPAPDADPVPLKESDFALSEQAETPGDKALDVDYNNDWDGAPAPQHRRGLPGADWGRGGGQGFNGAEYNLEQTISQEIGLRDHLIAQFQVELTDPTDRLIASDLVDGLDETGRLSSDLGEVAARLGCPPARVESVLERLQRLDPPGIFARDLAECWAIQLAEQDRLDPAMRTLLENLDLLEKHDFRGLAKACALDMDDIRDMVEELGALNHRPAAAFDQAPVQPIIPDVVMRPADGGGWLVELNTETLPRVLVNQSYCAEISAVVSSKEDKRYVAEKIQSANWLVKALHQRATTILRVAEELVRQQDAFFRDGVEHLKPLVLRDIAEAIEMHESTVSRVTSNKYMVTPRGIFELKYFFTPAIASTAVGEVHSAEFVRHRIKALIDGELPAKVLSDDKMVDILEREGIDIARRTVAKYRESMRIPSSVQRRRLKAASL